MRILPFNVRTELADYISGKAEDLSSASLDWFRANKDLALTRPLEIYQGKNFSETEGNLVLRGAIEGGVVPYPHPTCSTWCSALNDARCASLNSENIPFLEIRQRYLDDESIPKTNLGLVLAIVTTPESVLCSLERVDRFCKTEFATQSTRGDIILRPQPSLQARVINIYSKQTLSPLSGVSGIWDRMSYITDNTPGVM